MISRAELLRKFFYDPATGHLIRVTGPLSGQIAGYVDPKGAYYTSRTQPLYGGRSDSP